MACWQPRVTPSLPTAQDGSVYQRVFSSPTGIDPYASAVSDVYQDLFEEGSYSGKGIYDVDALEGALAGRIAESSVLSHDLLEGIFARAGLVSDVEVFEDFPSRYDVAASRQHRWARGDWQLLSWITGKRPAIGGELSRTGIPLLGRWKLADNLRRTLLAPASFLALLTGWILLPPAPAVVWCGFVFLPFLLSAFLPLVARVIPRRPGISTGSHFRAFRLDFRVAMMQFGLQVALLAHQAWLMVDAIVRTLSRLYRQRQLLEWVTAAAASSDRELGLVELLSAAGRRCRVECVCGRCRCLRRPLVLVDSHSVARRLDAVTGHRVVGEPGATSRPEDAAGGGLGKPAPHGAAHLALL